MNWTVGWERSPRWITWEQVLNLFTQLCCTWHDVIAVMQIEYGTTAKKKKKRKTLEHLRADGRWERFFLPLQAEGLGAPRAIIASPSLCACIWSIYTRADMHVTNVRATASVLGDMTAASSEVPQPRNDPGRKPRELALSGSCFARVAPVSARVELMGLLSGRLRGITPPTCGSWLYNQRFHAKKDDLQARRKFCLSEYRLFWRETSGCKWKALRLDLLGVRSEV